MRTLLVIASLFAAGLAHAQNCSIDLEGNDQVKFDKETITVDASCEAITINLKHVGKLPAEAMGHNVVITATADYQAVAQDGLNAGPAGDYLPADDPRIIAHTEIIGGGETISATFPGNKLEAEGDYTFFCSFPGHWTSMKGRLIVE
jgi:azurin